MSKAISLLKNPVSNPEKFTVVPHDQVQAGDIYQGSRSTSKWYANTEGQRCVDTWRTYYRAAVGAAVGISDRTLRRRMSHVSPPPGSQQRSSAPSAAIPQSPTPEARAKVHGESVETEEIETPTKTGVEFGEIENHEGGLMSVTLRVTIDSKSVKEAILDVVQDELNKD